MFSSDFTLKQIVQITAESSVITGVTAMVTNGALGGRSILWLTTPLQTCSWQRAATHGAFVAISNITTYVAMKYFENNDAFNPESANPEALKVIYFVVPVALSLLTGSTVVQAIALSIPGMILSAALTNNNH